MLRIEDTLLLADLGVGPTTELVDALRAEVRVTGIADPEQLQAVLADPGQARVTVAPCPHHPRRTTTTSAASRPEPQPRSRTGAAGR